MIRRPPRSTRWVSSAASDVYKRQQKQQRCMDNTKTRLKKYLCFKISGGKKSEVVVVWIIDACYCVSDDDDDDCKIVDCSVSMDKSCLGCSDQETQQKGRRLKEIMGGGDVVWRVGSVNAPTQHWAENRWVFWCMWKVLRNYIFSESVGEHSRA